LKGSVTVSGDWLHCIPAGHIETSIRPKHLIVQSNENDSTGVLLEICARLEFYAAENSSFILTFWDSLLVPSSRVKDLGLLELEDGTNR
jgi:hypothetical protein